MGVDLQAGRDLKALILPGLDGTGLLHGPFARALEPEIAATSVAYPSHLCRYEDLHDWLTPQLPDAPFVVIAESFSGPLALRIAAELPERVAAVVLVASFDRPPRRVPPIFAAPVRYLPQWGRAIGWVTFGAWATVARRAALKGALAQVSKRSLARRLKSTLSLRRENTIVPTPTLYLKASKDRLVPARHSAAMKSRGAVVVVVEGPHFLLQANPSDCATAIRDFLRAEP